MGKDRLMFRYCLMIYIFLIPSITKAQDSLPVKTLPGVRIVDRKRNFVERNDTIIYDAKAFMSNEVHKVKDLLSFMPGFSVDENGRVMFNGREIKHIMINGEDLTGNKYEAITKNLQAGLISRVELVKRYHENRLLSSVEWGDEQAINLVVDEHKKYKVNAQHTFGTTPDFKKKELDGNVISIYKRATTLMFFDMNNHGRNPTFSLFPDNALIKNFAPFRFPYSYIPTYLTDDIAETYLRNNNDKGVNISHTHKIFPHLSLLTKLIISEQKLIHRQDLISSFLFPGMDELKYENKQFNRKAFYQTDLHLNMKYDNLKRHISSYQFYLTNNRQSSANLQYSTLPLMDTAMTNMSGLFRMLAIQANETFQLSRKYVLESESNLVIGKPKNHLDISSHALPFLQGVPTGSSILIDDAKATERMFTSGLKILFKWKKSFFQLGIKLENQRLYTLNNLFAKQMQDSIEIVSSNGIFHLNRISIYGKREQEINKHLMISLHSSLGISGSIWKNQKTQQLTGNVLMSLNYQKNAFRTTNLFFNLTRGLPNKNLYFTSPILNTQMQFMNGAPTIVYPVKASLHLAKAYNDLYKGFSVSSNISIEKKIYSLLPTLNQFHFYSIHGYELGKEGMFISSSCKIQKNLFPYKIKPYVDIRVNSSNQKISFNGSKNNMSTIFSEFQVGVVSYWNTKLNVESSVLYRSTFLQMKPMQENGNSHDFITRADLKFKCEIAKKTYASIYGVLLKNRQYMYSTTFLDGYLEHTISERLMCVLKMHNLLNQTMYTERPYAAYFTQTTSVAIVPRYIMFSVQINL